jgi:hypothetical protein
MTVQRGKQGWLFQPLTLIRQTGTLRAPDGSTTYTFAALVHPDLPPVKLTLTVTVGETLRATACFDETLREAIREEGEHYG